MNKYLSTKTFVLTLSAILIFGLTFIGGLYYILNYQYQNTNISPLLSGSPVTSEPVSLTLNLTDPSDNLLTTSSAILVTGETSPAAVVIFNLNEDYSSLEAGDKGGFSTTLKLTSGVNKLAVTVFDNLGNSKIENRTLYYSTEKI